MAATFSFYFVEIGQGDFCMVRCPDGQVVIVDCGRTANAYGDLLPAEAAKVALRGKQWAGAKGNSVAAVILTHPDADHHNMLVEMLIDSYVNQDVLVDGTKYKAGKALTRLTVEDIYISTAPTQTSSRPLGNYRGAALNANVYAGNFGTPSVHEVNINSTTDTDNSVTTWQASDGYDAESETAVANGRHTVLSGVTEGTTWSVEIIAGNVERGYGGVDDKATPDNARSLITLFKVGARRALLCGDATFSTEAFLLDEHAALIEDVDLLQVPHHGSAFASSRAFVKKVNPRAAVVSVGFLEHSYRLPRYAPIQAWQNKVDARDMVLPSHHVDSWRLATAPGVQAISDQWTKNPPPGGTGINQSQTCMWMNQPDIGVWAIYMSRTGGMRYYRDDTTSPLTATSQKTQSYTLTKDNLTYTG